jgi:hypothetical protein
MKYHEAAEIAKKNPGSVVKKNGHDFIVVINKKRKIPSTSTTDKNVTAPAADLAERIRKYRAKYWASASTKTIVKNRTASTAKTVAKHKVAASTIKVRKPSRCIDPLDGMVKSLREQEIKLATTLRDQNKYTVCSCGGSNSNCCKCDGKGRY